MARGHVRLWVDVLDPYTASIYPPHDISPEAQQPFELRMIVWRTRKVCAAAAV
jgi:hypothetical protein